MFDQCWSYKLDNKSIFVVFRVLIMCFFFILVVDVRISGIRVLLRFVGNGFFDVLCYASFPSVSHRFSIFLGSARILSEFLAISYDVPCHPQMDFLRGCPKCFSRYCHSTMERAADILKTPLHIKEGSKEIKMDLVRHWEIVLGPISIVGVLDIPQKVLKIIGQ